MRGIYKVLSYDGTIEKKYRNYKAAYRFCNKLIAKDIMCGIYELIVEKNDNGSDDLETLRWVCVIGC